MRTKGLLPACAYCFAITLMVFPGMIQDTSFKFMHGWEHEESWFVLFTLTLFNVFDTIGRSAASWKCMELSRKTTLVLNYLRTAFLPLIFAIAFEWGPAWLFNSDWFKLVNLALFAFTNGWLSSLCVIMTPDYVK
mmetsp:Transcript_34011/g.41939  ORF Transcript_34011/g.41939 Transcript_34011/m.41939 type:complete len:135 (+) Transcript_34011:898-1302(+)